MDDIKSIFLNKQPPKKAPAYQWQDLALRVIKELSVPDFKRSSVFKVCRDYNQAIVLQALTDTRELCQTGQKWQYFFKVLSPKSDNTFKPKNYKNNARNN